MALFLFLISFFSIFLIKSGANALTLPPPAAQEQTVLNEAATLLEESPLTPPISSPHPEASISSTLKDLLDALSVMQESYFELWLGTWPTSIDWTAAVLGTHVSATLSSLTSTGGDVLVSALSLDANEFQGEQVSTAAFENVINHFFAQTSAFYFGENSLSLRGQAFDDMLWVVLGWLENIKLQVLHSDLHYDGPSGSNPTEKRRWHGAQFQTPAAHRARVFYELASSGWDNSLCGGGMIWSPYLTPYKNAITNELYVSASIGMYLYHPGDVIDSPFMASTADNGKSSDGYPHNPFHLQAAIEGYKWLKQSNMIGIGGLYADGFHISGWRSEAKPGTRKCDVLNPMVYTYNQGVILSGLRGLWLATASDSYLQDGHELVHSVIRATGWPNKINREWAGLGRGGVLEDFCDSSGGCSQNGQTFKGIFFHHLTEFCRPMHPQEERFLAAANQTSGTGSDWKQTSEWHQAQCRDYLPWIEHNANAALMTRDDTGKFGMWWGARYLAMDDVFPADESPLPQGAIDYQNHGNMAEGCSEQLVGALRSRAPEKASDRIAMHDLENRPQVSHMKQRDYNDRGRGRTVETQSGGVAVLRALYQWKTSLS